MSTPFRSAAAVALCVACAGAQADMVRWGNTLLDRSQTRVEIAPGMRLGEYVFKPMPQLAPPPPTVSCLATGGSGAQQDEAMRLATVAVRGYLNDAKNVEFTSGGFAAAAGAIAAPAGVVWKCGV